MLQGQQMKLVGTQCFNTDFNLYDLKCDGKVYYESKIFKENLRLFSRYSQLNNCMGNPDSNLLAVNQAAENSNATWEFIFYISSQIHVTGIKEGKLLLKHVKSYCDADLSEEGTVSFKIADSNLCSIMFLAVHSVYACWIGVETRNRARKGSVAGKILEKHCVLVHGWER
jgi:hypothetical protein